MPSPDFDLYLSLLGKLLKLRPEQTDAIRDELQDHLEERFRELCGQGRSRDAAIRQALDEFGDAALLADQFTRLAQLRRRRWIMRFTLAGSLLSAVILLAVFAFWPTPPDGPSATPLVAADPPRAAAAETLAPRPAAPTFIDPARFLPELLTQRTGPELEETSLAALANLLKSRFHIPVLLDEARMADLGVGSDVPVLLVPDLPIYLLLNHVLAPHDLTWYWDRGVLRISTIDYASQQFTTENYPISHLLKRTTTDRIIDAIQNTTGNEEYGPWVDIHGTGGSIDVVGDLLTIRHPHRVHAEIKGLLEALAHPAPELFTNEPAENMHLRQALSAVRVSADFNPTSLLDVIHSYQEKSGLPFRFDETRMADLGIGTDTEIILQLPELPLDQMLELILTPHGLTPVVLDGAITITTSDFASQVLHTVVYDVSDILATIPGIDALLDVIQNETGNEEYGPWVDIHGNGGAIESPISGVLVIRQTDRVLTEIRDLIAAQRAAAKGRTPPTPRDPNAIETRYYRLPEQTAKDLLATIPEHIAPGTWRVVGFHGEQPDKQQIGTIEAVFLGTWWGFDGVRSDPRTGLPTPRVGGGWGGGMGGSGGGFFQLQSANPPAANSPPPQPANVNQPQAPNPAEKPDAKFVYDSALIVRHRAAVHDELTRFLNLLLFDDPEGDSMLGSVPSGVIRTEPAPAESVRGGLPSRK